MERAFCEEKNEQITKRECLECVGRDCPYYDFCWD